VRGEGVSVARKAAGFIKPQPVSWLTVLHQRGTRVLSAYLCCCEQGPRVPRQACLNTWAELGCPCMAISPQPMQSNSWSQGCNSGTRCVLARRVSTEPLVCSGCCMPIVCVQGESRCLCTTWLSRGILSDAMLAHWHVRQLVIMMKLQQAPAEHCVPHQTLPGGLMHGRCLCRAGV